MTIFKTYGPPDHTGGASRPLEIPVVAMSAPIPPPHLPSAASPARTEWLGPRPLDATPPEPGRPMIPPTRSRLATVIDVVARVGTAVTLAALLIVTGTVLTMVDAAPVPTGAATAGR
jgi:hypothetical protein